MRDMICPRCNSGNIIKNGNTIHCKPKFMCRDCRKQFVENPDDRKITYKKMHLQISFFRKKFRPPESAGPSACLSDGCKVMSVRNINILKKNGTCSERKNSSESRIR